MAFLLETARLSLRPFTLEDDAFILRLLNEPSFVDNIADKGVRTLADARSYLENGPLASYEQHGFGLWRVSLRGEDAAIGMCGLIQRSFLADLDLGYAFLPEHEGKGYATEAAAAALGYAQERLGRRRVVAIVSPGNRRSIRVLEKLGFRYESELRMPGDSVDVQLFGWRKEA